MRLWRQKLIIFAPVAAMLCLFVFVLAFSMDRAARETDAVDVEKTRQALREVLRVNVDRLAGVASDNAYWDDAADAVYRPTPDLEFIRRTWGASTADGTNYDGAYVIGADGRSILGLRDGKDDPTPIARRLDSELAVLARRPQVPGGGIGGIVMLRGKPTLLGVAQILPTSDRPGWKLPEEGVARLILVKRIDNALLERLGRSLVINDLRISRFDDGGLGLPLVDVHGKAIAWFVWTPGDPGYVALRRSLPLTGLVLVLALSLSAIMIFQAARFVSRLARQALLDSLSGLPNLRALRRELARRLNTQDHVALCLLDLDGFKFVNDNYGHGVGDRLIQGCATLLKQIAGEQAFVARLGGDEFAIIVSGSEAWEKARRLADTILERLGEPVRLDARTLVVGASIGLAQGYGDKLDAQELLRRADVAMYAAKRAGKMRVCVFDARLDHRQARMHQIENELRTALAAGDFRLVYQPLYDAASGSITSVEALLRWTSLTMGEVDPVEFIPVAEESGLIDPLGRFILRKVCEETRDWNMSVAVNVSAAQLRNPDFAGQVRTILEETGFPPVRLELEITETYLVSDPETAGRVLHELRELGVSIALDDFGTGYASIGFLRQFSFDKLKLDRSLVMDAENSEAARALLQASIAMARALNMEVTAEGVETAGQADLMRIAGCDQMQGWLFDKAMTGEQMFELMRAERAGQSEQSEQPGLSRGRTAN